MNKLISYLPMTIFLLAFNFMVMTADSSSLIAPKTMYWTCGFATSFFIINEVYEYKYKKMIDWYRKKYPRKINNDWREI